MDRAMSGEGVSDQGSASWEPCEVAHTWLCSGSVLGGRCAPGSQLWLQHPEG